MWTFILCLTCTAVYQAAGETAMYEMRYSDKYKEL